MRWNAAEGTLAKDYKKVVILIMSFSRNFSRCGNWIGYLVRTIMQKSQLFMIERDQRYKLKEKFFASISREIGAGMEEEILGTKQTSLMLNLHFRCDQGPDTY